VSAQYAELTARSNHSFLTGASFPEELVHEAARIGIAALGIADLNGVYGLPRAHEATKSAPAIKLICGAELKIEGHPTLTLLAQNRAGYGALCRLITQAHEDKPKGEAMLKFSELADFREHSGFAALSALMTEPPDAKCFLDLFGKNLSLKLTRFQDGHDLGRTERTLEISEGWGIPVVATNEVHYHIPTRRPLQDALTAIRHVTSVDRAGFLLFSNDERRLKTPAEMRRLFADQPRAIERTMEIAESCAFSLSELRYRYPSEWIPAGRTAQEYLLELSYEGAARRFPGGIPVGVEKQLQHEFSLIAELQFADYFLTVYDIVRFARERNILCQGRGSAANSVVCYCLGITAIDPVRMGLLFERFISRERGEPPDIDVDFEHERREEVIQYIYARYGRNRAAMVAAVVKYQGRNSILDLAKALGVEVGTRSALELARDFEQIAGPLAVRKPLLDQLTQEIDGFPRHISIHSGGFTLSATDLREIVPIEPARMAGRTIVQWDKNDLDALGLLKIDCLSLGALTALHRTLDSVGLEFSQIPAEDRKTYEMIQNAQTDGTFQIESRAQKASIVRTLPENFADLVVQVALVRPGPTVGQMVHPYITRRSLSRRGVPYVLPDSRLAPILGRTFGVPVFQEQIMKIAIEFAGFTPGEADQLRRAIAAWRSAGSVSSLGERLRQGLLKNGVPKDYAEELFRYLKGFSEYGFPESHAASFALIAYATAYLKCHHPAEFLCALINSQPMGFYSVDTLIHEAQRNGVTVLDLHPNESDWNAKIMAPRTVRMGWRSVHGVGEEVISQLMAHREQASFTGMKDFLARTALPEAVMHRLAMANAFRCFGLDQRHTLWRQLREQGELTRANAQMSLFERKGDAPARERLFAALTDYEEVLADYRAKEFSVRGDLMAVVRKQNSELPRATSVQVKAQNDGSLVAYAGLVLVVQRPPPAKGTAFITFEDETGTLDAIVRKSVFERHREIIRDSRFLILRGRLQKKGRGVSIIADVFQAFSPPESRSRAVQHGSHPQQFSKIY